MRRRGQRRFECQRCPGLWAGSVGGAAAVLRGVVLAAALRRAKAAAAVGTVVGRAAVLANAPPLSHSHARGRATAAAGLPRRGSRRNPAAAAAGALRSSGGLGVGLGVGRSCRAGRVRGGGRGLGRLGVAFSRAEAWPAAWPGALQVLEALAPLVCGLAVEALGDQARCGGRQLQHLPGGRERDSKITQQQPSPSWSPAAPPSGTPEQQQEQQQQQQQQPQHRNNRSSRKTKRTDKGNGLHFMRSISSGIKEIFFLGLSLVIFARTDLVHV